MTNIVEYDDLNDLSIEQQIEQFGRSIFMMHYDYCEECGKIHAQPGPWAYAYTIGNHLHGVPELIIFGLLDNDDANYYLNELSLRLVLKMRFKDGSIQRVDGIPLKIINASYAAQESYMQFANEYYGNTLYRVQQVLVPDDNNRHPGHPKALGLAAFVPVLRIS